MQNRPIHENLDTSFVNLSALVRYLRRRQFVGNIRVELSGYEADIVLSEDNQLKVREFDRIAGRVGEGEEALQRLLIRAREPGGIVHVYQKIDEPFLKKEEAIASVIEKSEAVSSVVETIAEYKVEIQENKPLLFASQNTAPVINGNGKTKIEQSIPTIIEEKKFDSKPSLKLPDFPFELSNKFETKARKNQLSDEDWQTLLKLTAELLKNFEGCLAQAQLNFQAAFQKACGEIAADYPFLNPNSGSFKFENGKVEISEQVSAKIFCAGINEALRRILEKLSANPKFSEIHRFTVQKILALIHHRKTYYDKFLITPQLEKILGV